MKFELYNPIKEKGSCILRTFMKIFDKSSDEIKAELTNLAKELNYENYKEIAVFEKYLYLNNYKKIYGFDNIRIGDIEFKSGKYVIFCYDKKDYYHMIPVINNTIYDKSSSCLDLYIISVYELK